MKWEGKNGNENKKERMIMKMRRDDWEWKWEGKNENENEKGRMGKKMRRQGWGIKMKREEWEWKGVSPVSLVE